MTEEIEILESYPFMGTVLLAGAMLIEQGWAREAR